MKAKAFEEQGESRWRELRTLLDHLEGRSKALGDDARLERLPALFRQVCHDLALAQHRMYRLPLIDRINLLVIRGYQQLHRGSLHLVSGFLRGVWYHFPRAVRAEGKLLWLVMVFFWVSFWGMFFSSYYDLRWIQSLLGPEMIEGLEMGFGKEGGVEKVRNHFGSDFNMFAFYIFNNVKIDFQIFAGGLLAGVGTLFFVIFNALTIGAAAGYVAQMGDPNKFNLWISGHVTPEFLGLLFSAMAGLRVGFALVAPGRLTRRQALVQAAKRAVVLLYGAAALTLLAAVIEGFWSPRPLSPEVKYGFGGLLTGILILYLMMAGRRRRET